MRNIQIDSDGELHCWSCGGKHFTEKRTFRAKAIGVTAGVATLGVVGAAAPLLAGKKLKCQVCGVYNQVGKADAYEPKPDPPAKPAKKAPTPTRPGTMFNQIDPNGYLSPDQINRRRGVSSHQPRPAQPPPAKTGQFLEVKKPKRPN